MECECNNPIYGFNCVCEHIKKYPGDIEYICEFCGIYKASKKSCNKCEEENINPGDYWNEALIT